MCDPLTLAAMSMVKTGLQIKSVNETVEAQTESINRQLEHEYQQAAYDQRNQAEAAIDEGYRSTIEKRQAVGRATVRNAALGIRGNTAADTVAEEIQVGNYNIASAKEQRRNADEAYTIGTHGSYGAAKQQIKAVQAQSPSMFESILSIGASGLTGYIAGMDVQDSLKGVPDKLKHS